MATPARVVETEVRAHRRRFSAAYQLRILQEADACTEPGPPDFWALQQDRQIRARSCHNVASPVADFRGKQTGRGAVN